MLQQECLDHFLIFGTRHMDYLLKEFLEHYHAGRPHQSKGNLPLTGDRSASARDSPPRDVTNVVYNSRLGGLLKHYFWREAA